MAGCSCCCGCCVGGGFGFEIALDSASPNALRPVASLCRRTVPSAITAMLASKFGLLKSCTITAGGGRPLRASGRRTSRVSDAHLRNSSNRKSIPANSEGDESVRYVCACDQTFCSLTRQTDRQADVGGGEKKEVETYRHRHGYTHTHTLAQTQTQTQTHRHTDTGTQTHEQRKQKALKSRLILRTAALLFPKRGCSNAHGFHQALCKRRP